MQSLDYRKEEPVTMRQLEEVLERAFTKNNLSLRAEIKEDTKKIVEDAIDEFAISVGKNFNAIDKRFDEVDKRFDKIDEELLGIKTQISGLNNRVDDFAESYVRKSNPTDSSGAPHPSPYL